MVRPDRKQGPYRPNRSPAPEGMIPVMQRLLGILLLVLVTLIWGTTFVGVKETVRVVPVPLLLAVRFTVGALILAPFGLRKEVLKVGTGLGVLLFVSFAFQSIGLQYTGASRAAFITGLSVVMVPLFAAGIFRRRVSIRVAAAAVLATAGLALLCFDLEPPNRGDLWVLACAVLFAFYVVALEAPVRRHGAGRLSLVQLGSVAILAWIWSAPYFPVLATLDRRSWLTLLYLGIAATGLTTLLQGLGQKIVSAPVAAVTFTLEPVFAACFAFLLLGEQPGARGWVGSALILGAMLLAALRGDAEARNDRVAETARP